jgi:hypothetical protein
MWIVRVNNVRSQFPNKSRQLPGHFEIQFMAWNQRYHGNVLLGTVAKFTCWMCHKRCLVFARLHAANGQQHLILSASPTRCCVDVH